MHEWNDFYVATAGAAAALTGLTFVGVSISLSKILSFRTLPGRALISLMLLFNILILSLLFLVPDQALTTRCVEVLIVTLAVWMAVSRLDILIYRSKEKKFRRLYSLNIILDQVAILPYILGASMLLAHIGGGMYLIVVSIIVSFIKAASDAWVLLVEINR